MVDKGYLARFVIQVQAISGVCLFLVQGRETPSQMKIYITFTKGKLRPTFGQKGRGQRVPSASAVSQLR